METKIIFT